MRRLFLGGGVALSAALLVTTGFGQAAAAPRTAGAETSGSVTQASIAPVGLTVAPARGATGTVRSFAGTSRVRPQLTALREATAKSLGASATVRTAQQGADRADAGLERAVDRRIVARLEATLDRHRGKDGIVDLTGSEPALDGMSALELVQWAQVAKDTGVPISSVISRYGNQQAQAELADRLASSYPGSFVGAEINEADGGAWFGFTGRAPAAAVAQIAALPGGARLQEGMRFSARDLTAQADAVRAAAGIPVDTAPDGRTQTIELTTVGQAGVQAREKAEQAAAAVARRMGLGLRSVRSTGVAQEHDGYARGGSTIHNGRPCTAGFVALTSSGAPRMLSAGHCTKAMPKALLTLRSMDGGTSAWVSRTFQFIDGDGDGGGYTLGTFKPMATFYAKTNLKSSVRGYILYPAKGTRVCKFGVTTGFTCGKIEEVGVKNSNGAGSLVRLDSNISDDGDSGGPFFAGNTAYGTLVGAVTCLPRSLFCTTFTPLSGYAKRGVKVKIY